MCWLSLASLRLMVLFVVVVGCVFLILFLQLSGGIFFVVFSTDGFVGLLGQGDGGDAFNVVSEHADTAAEHVVDDGCRWFNIFQVNDFDVADAAVILDGYSAAIGKTVVDEVEEKDRVYRLAIDDTERSIEVEKEQLISFITFNIEQEVLIVDGHCCFELAGTGLLISKNGFFPTWSAMNSSISFARRMGLSFIFAGLTVSLAAWV